MTAAGMLGVGLTGTTLTELERTMLREDPPYAVVLFARNIASAEQLRDYVREIKSIAAEPPLVLIDEEGGRVDRLRALVPGFPAASDFAALEERQQLARWFGRVIGRALRYFEIDVNLAPVVDVARDVPSPGLERRTFGRDAETVVELASAFIEGQEEAGVAACVKHFPGLGASSADTHYGASVVDVPNGELLALDVAPYKWLANRARAVMVSHALYPQLDPTGTPATLCEAIATGLLRGEAGFTGVAMTDDMEMHAVADLASLPEICERALVAGNDVMLFCSHVEQIPAIVERVNRRAETDEAFRARLEEAGERALAYRRHCAGLRNTSEPVPSFEALLGEVAEFRSAFDAAAPGDGGSGGGGRQERRGDRSGGTGKTGREEWT